MSAVLPLCFYLVAFGLTVFYFVKVKLCAFHLHYYERFLILHYTYVQYSTILIEIWVFHWILFRHPTLCPTERQQHSEACPFSSEKMQQSFS